jgi:CRP/FNR family cyclic AMP-dependent transcriptional regulator
VTELSRIGLLASLPGETLTRLAERMRREEVPPGRAIVTEGAEDGRFYALLSGMAAVAQSSLGPRRLLRPGDTFGEVAATMGIPRTATVTTITQCVVASCDRDTFSELLRPLFADDE